MYVPSHFKEDDTSKLHQYIRDCGFGFFVVADEKGIEANHIPFHLKVEQADSLGLLQCHVARANPVWQRLKHDTRVLVVFQGPNAYVSPSWYPSKVETGRVVPTWNYLAVHVEGGARVIQDSYWLKQHLAQLTDQHESAREEPWSIDDAPDEFIERLARGIVGIEIKIETLTGKLKASQNQPEANRAGVRAGLEGGRENDHAMSKLIS